MRTLIFAICSAMALAVQAEEKPAQPTDPVKIEEVKTDDGQRVVRKTDKEGCVTEETFDSDGNLIIKKDKVGNAWLYTYNQFKQCIREDKPDGSSILYEFDDPKAKLPSKIKMLGPDGKDDKRLNNAG